MTRRIAVKLSSAMMFSIACTNPEPTVERAPASLEAIGDLCGAQHDWALRCAAEGARPAPDPASLDECRSDPRWPLVFEGFVRHQDRCYRALDCAGPDDRCVDEYAADVGLVPDALWLECVARADECEGVSDDSCFGVLLYHDVPRDIVDSCLALPCAEFGACLLDPMGFDAATP
jgi:hypothetical protein